jgi:ribosomal protein S18 acetylase RimI-like enzyme
MPGSSSIDADTAATGLAETWVRLMAAHPEGWSRREPDVVVARSGVRLPMLNVVIAHGPDPRPETVAALLDELAATGVPHSLRARPGSAAALGGFARDRGMERVADLPLMVLDGRPSVERADGLAIRELDPSEVDVHTRLLAAGFEIAEDYLARLMVPELPATEGMRAYVGEVDGEQVATGFAVRTGEHVGIFSIATVPAARRRGHGAAITARAVEDGLEAGAAWAWLMTSPGGYGVYERLGFAEVESWSVWSAPAGER